MLSLALALGSLGGLRRFGAIPSAAAAGLAAAAAAIAAGGGVSSAAGAGLVVAGVAALAAGAAALALRLGAQPGGAVILGAALPALLAASVFLADPIIEWDGSGHNSPPLAHWIYRTNPIAAATSPAGGTGIDWQTRSLMYDGHGSGGLSVIGQYYPARPPSAPAWGALALLAGAALAFVGRAPRGRADDASNSTPCGEPAG